MANEQNLKGHGFHERTASEQREIAQKGGIASGESRRARKTFKEELIALLEANDTNKKISVALINRALDGDINAFTIIRDTIGEKPVAEQNVNIQDNTRLAHVLSQLKGNGLGDDD